MVKLTTNTIVPQVDLPAFQQLRFAPAVSSAISNVCSPDNSNFMADGGRYLFYLIGATLFFKYDTWTESYIQLTSPPIAPTGWASMKYSGAYGFEGNVLGAAGSTLTAPVFSQSSIVGRYVRIVSGVGDGQQRVIKDVSVPTIRDSGIVTAVGAGVSITDSLKNWTINEHVGRQIRITYGSGISHVRRILHNTNNTLTYADVSRLAIDYNANPQIPTQAFSATSPNQTVYQIEDSTITVDTAWDTIPDTTSKFRIFSGAITLLSSAAATPFYTAQVYDIDSDVWYIRSAITNLVPAAGSDGTIERTTENGSVWENGEATGGSTTTLIDTTKNWIVDEHKNYYLRVFSGAGRNQLVKIISNTSDTLTFAAVGTSFAAGSQYYIDGFDAGVATSGGAATLSCTGKTWSVDQWKNYALRIVSGTGAGQNLPIMSNTVDTITLYKKWDIQPDTTSNFVIQGDKDNIYFVLGGQASVFVHSFENDLATPSRVIDDGLCRVGSAQYGNMRPIPITSIAGTGTTKTVTTAIPHCFKTGWTISHKGDTGASAAQNNISAVITVTGATTYTYVATGSTAAATFGTLTTSTLIDVTKNWTVNEHANKVCYFATAAPVAATGLTAMVAMEILSNTANTLTFKTATTLPVNGVSRYSICVRPAIGSIEDGIATGTHSTTTLQDTSKNWAINIFAGRRCKIVSGAGQSNEVTIASNTATTLTFTAVTTLPVSASTSYSILSGVARSTGISLIWLSNPSKTLQKGKYCICARGGGAIGLDLLNLNTDKWEVLSYKGMAADLFNSGSMYAYDGDDRLYYVNNTYNTTVKYLDITTNNVYGGGIVPYAGGTNIIGNRLEVFKTKDNLKYLWFNRHSNQDCFRVLLAN